MIPQDARSQLQQQRWVEVYNAGGQTIPAHGVIEAIENTADDTEFRSYIHVAIPSRRGCPHVFINSMIPIEPGKTGWATDDLPAYALCESAGVGRMVGSDANSFSLVKDVPGFSVAGAGVGGALRVRKNYTTIIDALLASDLCPGTETAGISDAAECESMDVTSALNIYNLAGPGGSSVELRWSCQYEDWVVSEVRHRVTTPVIDIYSEEDPCGIFQSRLKQFSGMWCNDPVDDPAVSFYTSEIVVDLVAADYGSGIAETCKLRQRKKTICTINDLESQPYNETTAMDFHLVEVLIDVRLNAETGNIEGQTHYVFVPCDDPGRTVTLITTTPCDTSSS